MLPDQSNFRQKFSKTRLKTSGPYVYPGDLSRSICNWIHIKSLSISIACCSAIPTMAPYLPISELPNYSDSITARIAEYGLPIMIASLSVAITSLIKLKHKIQYYRDLYAEQMKPTDQAQPNEFGLIQNLLLFASAGLSVMGMAIYQAIDVQSQNPFFIDLIPVAFFGGLGFHFHRNLTRNLYENLQEISERSDDYLKRLSQELSQTSVLKLTDDEKRKTNKLRLKFAMASATTYASGMALVHELIQAGEKQFFEMTQHLLASPLALAGMAAYTIGVTACLKTVKQVRSFETECKLEPKALSKATDLYKNDAFIGAPCLGAVLASGLSDWNDPIIATIVIGINIMGIGMHMIHFSELNVQDARVKQGRKQADKNVRLKM